MKSSKQVLNYRQQKIKEILENEHQNDNDLTKKELIDKIRKVLEQDYRNSEHEREKRLRDEEIRRIRNLRMDGKITATEEEYLIRTTNKNDSSKTKQDQKIEKSEDNTGFNQEFNKNPTFVFKTRSLTLKENGKHTPNEHSDNKVKHKNRKDDDEKHQTREIVEHSDEVAEKNETKEIDDENKEEKANEKESEKEKTNEENQIAESNENQATVANDDDKNTVRNGDDKENEKEFQFRRELSEATLTLINETDLEKLYELAEKMVFISSKK